MYRVIIVDDHPVFRKGLKSILEENPEFKVVGEASSGQEAIIIATERRPDLILMDLNMHGEGGVEVTRMLKSIVPGIKVLILTVSENRDDILDSLEAGAMGYVLKSAPLDQLVNAIRVVAGGDVIVSASIANRLVQQIKEEQKLKTTGLSNRLTPREIEVLKLVAQGNSNKMIASKLVVSENTVKAHLRSILEALQVSNRAQAAAEAVSRGLLK